MRKYKVTGKFCILDEADNVIKDEVFVNKIVESNTPRLAIESAVKIMSEKFALKYEMNIKLGQMSNVLVKRV